jgi:hypothetical protein
MDEAVLRSMLKWPGIPAVYGWLRLDRRGMWRIRTGAMQDGPVFEPIGNAALREFIGRNYAADERGRWFFQNGPQTVYVALAYAPYVFRVEGGALFDHCGTAAGSVDEAWVDDEGGLLLKAGLRVGLLDDRDLASCADEVMEGIFQMGGRRIPVGSVTRAGLGERFGFVADPQP